jgi:hypothetical protein
VIDSRAWFPPLDLLYASRETVANDRTLFQGDVFRDIPCPRYPIRDEHEDPVGPRGRRGPVMVLGHPCEISPGEKGDDLPWRLVCPVAEDKDRRVSLDGEGHWYAFPLPDLMEKDDLWYADFRFLATISASHLDPSKRIAALSEVGWHALQRRLAHFLTRVAIDWRDLQEAGEGLHPN